MNTKHGVFNFSSHFFSRKEKYLQMIATLLFVSQQYSLEFTAIQTVVSF